jgi:hypothetical protein
LATRRDLAFLPADTCIVNATAVSTWLPLVARSSHDFQVDNPLGGCRKDKGSHVARSLDRLRNADRGADQQRAPRLLAQLVADPQQTR